MDAQHFDKYINLINKFTLIPDGSKWSLEQAKGKP
jgi:hypothetical protein